MSDIPQGQVSLEQGLNIVHTNYVLNIIRYLDTNELNTNNQNYIKCYS